MYAYGGGGGEGGLIGEMGGGVARPESASSSATMLGIKVATDSVQFLN